MLNSRTSRPVAGRRSDAGQIRLTDRDNRGLVTLSEMYAAPGDLLAEHLGVAPARLRGVTSRWRNAGLIAAGRLVAGPQWYWLTAGGMRAVGHGWRPGPPPLSRVAHIRAVLAARMWAESDQSWAQGQAWWRCERRIRAGRVAAPGHPHIPDAEIEWPSVPGSPSAGQTWAVEVELTAKPAARTTRIIAALLDGPYEVIVYLCAPAALPVVTTAASKFPDEQAARIVIRDLPPAALMRMPS
jgi:hypothetical protein